MKSMVLKDLYNIKCNAKSVLVSFLILAVAMASPGVGVPYAGAVLCSSLIIAPSPTMTGVIGRNTPWSCRCLGRNWWLESTSCWL